MIIQRLLSLPEGMPSLFQGLEKQESGKWFCASDPPQTKLGSGGGTAYILWKAYQQADPDIAFKEWLKQGSRLLIHSGGESRRLPAYAPYGKSLLPMPVFRWSKGQDLDQKLLGFQARYYESILKNAPDCYSLLVSSGDVLLISKDRFQDLPEADVLLLGIWVDEETASRHGVFFSRHNRPGQLAFVKQKPRVENLREWSEDYLYLMDTGIVLLSAYATMELMKQSGWQGQGFRGEQPDFYDLYGDMLTHFGQESASEDPVLSQMNVQLYPLHEGEFYHFGSNRDLIDSSVRLQNRISDQRLKLVREPEYHPSIFQQNALVRYRFGPGNHHIWIENSHIPESWKLHDHHVLTGIVENDWELDLPAGICVDLVPLEGNQFGLRIYGFEDTFRGKLGEEVHWMNQSLKKWLEKRKIRSSELGWELDQCIYDMPLFPVCPKEEIRDMLELLLDEQADTGRWYRASRMSARELARVASAEILYEQRHAFRKGALPRLAGNHAKSIFYYLDLEKTARDYRRMALELPPELSPGEPLIKRINDNMFRARATSDSVISAVYEREAFALLRDALIQTLKSEEVRPVRNLMDDQILWGRSPVRLDLAGGWTDTPPYCILEGGKVVNLSVELNGQLPLQVYARPIEEAKIVLRSIDLGEKLEVHSFAELENYASVGGVFSIPKAALVIAGFGKLFDGKHFPDLKSQLEEFGCGIELSLLAAVPKGSGLGTSSNLAATVLATLSDFCGLNWDRHAVAYRTLILEQMLTSGGGWQDQYGGIFQGIKLLETQAGIRQDPGIKWLPDQLFTHPESHEMMLLYYTGITRVAHDILGEIVKGMFLNSGPHLEIFSEMKFHALETFETILGNDYAGLAQKVAHSWELNQRLDEGTNPPAISRITRQIDDYLLGYKLLGAGGGGYLFMMAKSREAAVRVRNILESDPPNPRARFVDFAVSKSGFQLSRS